MNQIIKYTLALLVVVILAILFLFVYEYTQRETALEQEVAEVGYIIGSDGLPSNANYWTLPTEEVAKLAAQTTDPEHKANHLLRIVDLAKRVDPYDLEGLVSAYRNIYNNSDLNDQERALALFKISQQANGYNRFDLLDEFLPPEASTLEPGAKNYLMNQKIYDLYPMGIVYMDLRLHEILRGDEFNRHAIYMDTYEKLDADVEEYMKHPHLANLTPDLYMHAGNLISLIDNVSIPVSVVVPENVLSLYDQGESMCDASVYISPRCTTRDFIKIARIDYLLKIGETEQAEEAIDEFLASDLRPMIRAYITEYEGLSLGRYKYLEARPDLVQKLITTIPTLPPPTQG
ncbi:MAG: hypothetical protein KC877_01425 [Candidatus Kaiserbacteria bacterium]|nr:hypothetical protein [Candidatus Kaiserbacteria bacterium]MCB9816664.1 hypothetical protein [Candidatus Nomurabacteria bacterium]